MQLAGDRSLGQVLVIEDNPGDALLIQEAFEDSRAGCRIIVARDGDAARQWLDASPEPPRLILLDLNLPKQNGLEILREVKTSERWRLTPVVVLTSSRAARDISSAYGLHCNAYVRKPSSYADYARLIQLIGAFWLDAAALPFD